DDDLPDMDPGPCSRLFGRGISEQRLLVGKGRQGNIAESERPGDAGPGLGAVIPQQGPVVGVESDDAPIRASLGDATEEGRARLFIQTCQSDSRKIYKRLILKAS